MQALITLLSSGLPFAISVMGVYLLLRLRAFPYLHPVRTARAMLSGGGALRSLSALALALSGTLGVGNITGVALALSVGGAGAILWMWVSALLAMPVRYGEVVLALDGGAGGSRLHTLCLLALAPTLGGALQSAAAAEAAESVLSVPPPLTGLCLALLAAAVVFGGAGVIRRAAGALIPLLSLLYLFLSGGVILTNAARLPSVLSEILREAFRPSAAVGGLLGTLTVGFSRGLLSNEAGCGTAPYAHAEAKAVSPARQGLFGIAEVGIDTLLFCTATALAILLSGFEADGTIAPLVSALDALFGRAAPIALTISLALFAYATVLAFSHYGTAALASLTSSRTARSFYLLVMLAAVALGAALPISRIAATVDLLLAVMTYLTLARLVGGSDRIVTLTAEAGLLPRRRKRAEEPLSPKAGPSANNPISFNN